MTDLHGFCLNGQHQLFRNVQKIRGMVLVHMVRVPESGIPGPSGGLNDDLTTQMMAHQGLGVEIA